MTDNAIIAKALGWKRIDDFGGYVAWVSPGGGIGIGKEPGYDADLNLIHSAEDALTEVEWLQYLRNLSEVICQDSEYWAYGPHFNSKMFRHATAAQCAPALAKVLGQRR